MRRTRTPASALVVALALGGCSGPQDFLSTAGPAARSLAHVGGFALLVFSGVTVAVWLLLLAIALRRRGSFDAHAPLEAASEGQSWILVGGFAIPVAILAVVFVAMLSTLKAFPMEHAGDAPSDILVTGRQWWFDAEYRFGPEDRSVRAPGELHIPAGRPVEISLQTRDVIHSFWVPKLHGKVDLVPGLVNRIRIQADAPGIYDGQCAEFCGVQHAHMRLRVVAEAPDAFAAWLERQRAPAAAPVDADAQRGAGVFQRAACPLCHAVRGTAARGDVGPDLTHVGSRTRIAGGSLPNDTAHLEAWITHAQSLKPGAQMPDLTSFSGEELRQLTAYLQSLE